MEPSEQERSESSASLATIIKVHSSESTEASEAGAALGEEGSDVDEYPDHVSELQSTTSDPPRPLGDAPGPNGVRAGDLEVLDAISSSNQSSGSRSSSGEPPHRLRREESLNDFVRSRVDLKNFAVPGISAGVNMGGGWGVGGASMGGSLAAVSAGARGDDSARSPDKSEPASEPRGLLPRLRSVAATRFPRLAMKPRTQSGGDSMRVAVASEEEDDSLVTDSANVRQTCGFDLRFKVLPAIAVPMVVLVLCSTLAVFLPSFIVASTLWSSLFLSWNTSIAEFNKYALDVQNNVSSAVTASTMQSLSLLVLSFSLNSAMLAAQNSLFALMSLRGAIEDLGNANASVYFGQPSWIGGNASENYFNSSVAPNLLRSTGSGIYNGLSALYVGYAWQEFAMAKINTTSSGAWPDEDHLVCVACAPNVSYVYGPPSAGNVTLTTTYPLRALAVPDWAAGNDSIPFNTTARPWYVLQSSTISALSNATQGGAQLGAWTDLYLFSNNSGFNKIGVTFTYPIAECRNYSCLRGVMGVDIGTATMSYYCKLQLRQLIETALVRFNPDLDEGERRDQLHKALTESALYFVQNRNGSQAGVLMASSQSYDGWSQELTYATSSKNVIVATSATLVNTKLPFGSSQAWGDRYATDNGTFTPFQDSYTTENGTLMLVSASALQTLSYSGFPVANGFGLTVVLVLVTPQWLFSEAYTTELDKLEQEVLESQNDANKEASTLRAWCLALIFCALAASMVASVIASWCFTSPLRRLDAQMRSIRDMEFAKVDREYHSRITEIRKIEETFQGVRNTLKVFAKFVPRSVVQAIIKNEPNARVLHVRRRQVTVLFSDIAGFTGISEKLGEKELLYLLTMYLTVMTHVVESYGGTVGEVLGDGILAFWNTPDVVEDHAALAVASALAQQECVRALNDQFQREMHLPTPLSIRIGINTGVVLTGNIGSKEKMKFGCIGDAVNAASRLEGLCKLYGSNIIVSEETHNLLPPGAFVTRELDTVRVKGRQRPAKLYEVRRLVVRLRAAGTAARAAASSPSRAGTAEKDPVAPPGSPAPQARKGPNMARFLRFLPSPAWKSTPKGDRSAPSEQELPHEALPGDSTSLATASSSFFGPIGEPAHENEQLELDHYALALRLFQAGDFARAGEALQAVVSSDDEATKVLAERVADAITRYGDVAPTTWEGIANLDAKDY